MSTTLDDLRSKPRTRSDHDPMLDRNAVPIGVFGGGGFGQGIARAAARIGRRVLLFSRAERPLGEAIQRTEAVAELAQSELIFVAVPSGHIPEVCSVLADHLDGSHLLVHVSRGLLGENLRTVTEVLRHETPCRRVGALAGPLVAEALAAGTPGGGVVGTRFPEVADAVREAIAGPTLRLYQTSDVVGVEVASATVGLLAVAAGYVLESGIGPGALGVLLTRGLVEAGRLGNALGAEERTFGGLAGFGDLLAAVAGNDRPEMRIGRAIARGLTVDEATQTEGAHVEALKTARRVADYAKRVGLETPIAETIADVLEGELSPSGAIERLMARSVLVE